MIQFDGTREYVSNGVGEKTPKFRRQKPQSKVAKTTFELLIFGKPLQRNQNGRGLPIHHPCMACLPRFI